MAWTEAFRVPLSSAREDKELNQSLQSWGLPVVPPRALPVMSTEDPRDIKNQRRDLVDNRDDYVQTTEALESLALLPECTAQY